MLRPLITVRQNSLNSNRLRLDDITPVFSAQDYPGGYGLPNIARSEVDYVQLSLVTPSGSEWATDPLNWRPSLTSLDLLSTDFLPVDTQQEIVYNPCAPPGKRVCRRQGKLVFDDGLYELTYEVYGKKGIPADVISYHLDVTVCPGDQVYVMRQGAWANITSQGTVDVHGRWTWSALDTKLVYEDYEVRFPLDGNAFRLLDKGTVTKVVTPDSTGNLGTSTDPTLVGAVTIRFLLTGVVARDIAMLAKKPLPDLSSVDFCSDSLVPLALARQQLDTLIREGIADETAPVILDSIKQSVNYLKA